jgi:sRNA-binding protein
VTLKEQRIAYARSQRAARDAKLTTKRARRAAKAAELARIGALSAATKYSELLSMSNNDLADQLKYFKIILNKSGFVVSQKNRTGFVQQVCDELND